MLRYLERIKRGVDINEETLAFDVIKSVGLRGSYMDAEHTLLNLRSGEIVYFDIFDRSVGGSEWEDIYARAAFKRKELLQSYENKVPSDIRTRLSEFAERYQPES
jgi:trimethylamine--corrinoid protein Co-methyltransferase